MHNEVSCEIHPASYKERKGEDNSSPLRAISSTAALETITQEWHTPSQHHLNTRVFTLPTRQQILSCRKFLTALHVDPIRIWRQSLPISFEISKVSTLSSGKCPPYPRCSQPVGGTREKKAPSKLKMWHWKFWKYETWLQRKTEA